MTPMATCCTSAEESRELPPTPSARPKGMLLRLDEQGEVMGITIVNAKWLIQRDGKITLTVPSQIETSAAELAEALGSVGRPARLGVRSKPSATSGQVATKRLPDRVVVATAGYPRRMPLPALAGMRRHACVLTLIVLTAAVATSADLAVAAPAATGGARRCGEGEEEELSAGS